jgi:hypothetical protein
MHQIIPIIAMVVVSLLTKKTGGKILYETGAWQVHPAEAWHPPLRARSRSQQPRLGTGRLPGDCSSIEVHTLPSIFQHRIQISAALKG